MGDLLFLARRDRASHIRIQDPRQPGRHDDRQLLVLTRNRMSRAKTCLLIYQAPEPYIHDAGAERASSACKHSSCNSCRMLRTKLLGFLHDGACSCIEPRTESPIISRSAGRDNVSWTGECDIDLSAACCPVLLWHGSDDPLLPARAHRLWLSANLPSAARCA